MIRRRAALGAGLLTYPSLGRGSASLPRSRHVPFGQRLAAFRDASHDLPVGDLAIDAGAYWKQVVAEDFSTDFNIGAGNFLTAYPNWWTANDGDAATRAWARYSPGATLFARHSTLYVYLHEAPNPAGVNKLFCAQFGPKFPGYGAGVNQNHVTYLRYAYRVKLPVCKSAKFVHLLWPQAGWPPVYEFDWIENNLDPTAHVSGFNHYGASAPGSQEAYSGQLDPTSAWMTIVGEWTPSAVRGLQDGVEKFNWGTHVPGAGVQLRPLFQIEGILSDTSSDGSLHPWWQSAGHVQIAWAAYWLYQTIP